MASSFCLALSCPGLASAPWPFLLPWSGLAGWQNFCAGKTKYLDSKYTNTQIHRQTHTHTCTHIQTGTKRLAAHTHKIYAHTQQEQEGERERESHAERELEHSLPRIYQPKTMRCSFFFFLAKYPIIAAYAIETGSK